MSSFDRFAELWAIDFEFSIGADRRPWPLCMCAHEIRSGRTIKMWREELHACRAAPFDVGPDTLVIGYSLQAECDCFLSLGWELPVNICDLYVEYLATRNPTPMKERKLLHALSAHGLSHAWHAEKEEMQQKAATQTAWSESDKAEMITYCSEDVTADCALFKAMAPTMDVARMLYYGRFIKAVACMYSRGIPVDAELHRAMAERWDEIKLAFIRRDAAEFDVYDGTTFKQTKFLALLERLGISWPVTEKAGRPRNDHATWSRLVKQHPGLEPLRRVKATITDLRLNKLPVGSDGRARCWLGPFWTSTGRSLPSPSEFIFAMPKWVRGLIQPPPGYGFAYLDFGGQEVVIAAGLSGDEVMQRDVLEADPYVAFGIRAKLLPEGATKQSHPTMRDALKVAFLGSNYGMTAYGLAAAVGIPLVQAEEILARHRSRYRVFYRWRDDMVASALFTGSIATPLGWTCRVGPETSPRTLMDFPCQAGGGDMLRAAVIAGTDAGLSIVATVHDAIALTAPLDEFDDAVETMRRLMAKAGELITGGLPVRVETEAMIRYPERFPSPPRKGRDTWTEVLGVLRGLGQKVA
jgi:DNA polymerase I-like protein with 3'-5' exonuclease and polymerase domains